MDEKNSRCGIGIFWDEAARVYDTCISKKIKDNTIKNFNMGSWLITQVSSRMRVCCCGKQ